MLPIIDWVYESPNHCTGLTGNIPVFSIRKTPFDVYELTTYLPFKSLKKKTHKTEYGAKHAASEEFKGWLYIAKLEQKSSKAIQRETTEKYEGDDGALENS